MHVGGVKAHGFPGKQIDLNSPSKPASGNVKSVNQDGLPVVLSYVIQQEKADK